MNKSYHNEASVSSIISSSNSTRTPLLANNTFTGVWEDITNYASISILAKADVIGTLYCDFSADGTTADRVIQLSSGTTADMGIHTLIPVAKYFRIRVINGVSNQTSFTLQTLYNTNSRISFPTSRMEQTINSYSDVLNTRAVLFGRNENNETYQQIGITAQNNLKIAIKDPLTAFNEVLTENLTSRVQLDAIYGLLDTDVEQLSASGGSTSGDNSLFTCSTGTTLGAYAVIRSKRTVRYLPGQGVRFRFTSRFDAGVANSFLMAGAFTVNNGLFFGYRGTQFGILRRIAGRCHIARLTITVGSNGTEQITINLNSVAFTFTPTALSTSALAEYIAETVAFTGWASSVSPKSNGATITFIQNNPAVANGTYSYATNGGGGGTSAGTFTTLQTGLANDDTTDFIPQTSWNLDVCDGSNSSSNPSGILLNPQNLNVYQIVLPYLGAGCILFSVMDEEGHFEYVHQIEYPNNYTIPNQQNPSYKIGWVAASLGSTTNLSVSGASCAGFIEGQINPRRFPFSHSVSNFSAGTTEYVVFALRVRGEYRNINNQREIELTFVSSGIETSNRVLTVKVYINPTLTGTTNWQYVNQDNSCVEYANPTTLTPSNGIITQQFIVASGAPLAFKLENIRLSIGDVVAISATTASGTAISNYSMTWQE